jgi:hypothetical protein
VRPAEEAEELVEPAPLRVPGGGVAEVPLADQPRDVPGGAEAVGEGRFRERQTDLRAGTGVELVAEPRLVAAGEHPGPGRRAVRAGHVAVGEPGAGLRQRVEVRRGDVAAAVDADVGVAHVVADDEDDVRLRRVGGAGG